MLELLDELEAVLASGHSRAAMQLVFVIPDHAAALGALDGTTSGKRYAAWFDANMLGGYLDPVPWPPGSAVPFMSGLDCWYYRCALLHQSVGEHPKATRRRISFSDTNHLGVIDDMLVLELETFVHDMTRSAREWFKVASRHDPSVIANLKNRIQLRRGLVDGVDFGDSVFL